MLIYSAGQVLIYSAWQGLLEENNCTHWDQIYRIQPNYHTCSYKRTVKQFCSLQITASVIFVSFFIKAYVVGTHLNCID